MACCPSDCGNATPLHNPGHKSTLTSLSTTNDLNTSQLTHVSPHYNQNWINPSLFKSTTDTLLPSIPTSIHNSLDTSQLTHVSPHYNQNWISPSLFMSTTDTLLPSIPTSIHNSLVKQTCTYWMQTPSHFPLQAVSIHDTHNHRTTAPWCAMAWIVVCVWLERRWDGTP
jgi:hypothetical protein